MNKRFSLSFRKNTSLPSAPPWADGYWVDCNPGPTDAFPETEKENLSIYLYSSLLGGNPIELKLENYGDEPNQKQFRSAPIPWNYANGSRELLEYSGLYDSDPHSSLPLTVQYFLEAREVVAGGESFAHEGSGPDWDQIDASTMTHEWIWYLTAVWTYENRSERLLLIPDYMERTPEALAGPGARTLFGDYYVISNHWEAMYWEDGMGYVDGYYDGLTKERTLFIISQTDHLNG
jgi:hypothetical protein